VSLTLPQHLVVEMPLGPGTVTLGGEAGLALFGSQLGLRQDPAAAPRLDARTAAVILPLSAEPGTLKLAAQQAASYRVAGEAPVLAAGLAFPAADLPRPWNPLGFGPVDGRPAVHLGLGAGLSLTRRW
jgi:hypothetical protein